MSDASNLQFEAQKLRMELIRELGLTGYKFMITLNSGAFLVLLTFLGSLDSSTAFSINLLNLKCSMFAFLGAITGTFLSMAIAYLSAQFNLLGRSLPFASGTAGHLFWMLLPLTVAFCLFILGGYLAITGIQVK